MEALRENVAANRVRYAWVAIGAVVFIVAMVVGTQQVGAFLDDVNAEAAEGLIDGATNGNFGDDRNGLSASRNSAWNDTDLTYDQVSQSLFFKGLRTGADRFC